MACPQPLFELFWELSVTGTQSIVKVLGKPFDLTGASELDFSTTIIRSTGNAQAIPGYLAMDARPEQADSPTLASGSQSSTAGVTTHNTADLSGITAKKLGQIVISGSLSSAGNPAYICGTTSVDLAACGKPIGRRVIEVSAQSDATNHNSYSFGRVPASNASDVRTGMVVEGAKDIEVRLYARGINDKDAPGTLVALGAGWTSIADGNSAVCIPDTAVSGVTPSSYHRLEVMLAVRMKAGGSAPAGRITAAASMAYA